MGHLDGKVAIVTGAGGGIGRAVAALFAEEGAAVVVADPGVAGDGTGGDPELARGVVAMLTARGARALACTESVATPTGAAAIVRAAKDAFGGVDVLVNLAGVAGDAKLSQLEGPRWERVLAVHLGGTLHMLQAAWSLLRQSRGHVVNTTSLAGMLGNGGHGSLAAADAGVYGLTRTASIELQRHGVTVNAVAPLAKTRLTEGLPMFERLDSLTPEQVAPAYLFFGSDLCGDRTGQVLAVAGGKLSLIRMQETPGRFKEQAAGAWTAAEIAEHWASIAKG